MSTFVHIECLIVIVTIECQSEVTGFLSNGDIFNYLHGTLSRFSSSWYFEDEYLSNGASYGQIIYYNTLVGNHTTQHGRYGYYVC